MKILLPKQFLMRFLADVNITQTLIKFLRSKNHNVLDIKVFDQKISDVEIIKLALKEGRIILTHDKDFEVLSKYPKYHVGIIKIRLKIQNSPHFCERINFLLKQKSEKVLHGSLTILEENSNDSYPY